MFKIVSIVIALVFIALGGLLGLLNPQTVRLEGYFFQAEISLSILLAITFVIGLFGGAMFLLSEVWRLKWQLMKTRRFLKKRESEIMKLRLAQVEAPQKTQDL